MNAFDEARLVETKANEILLPWLKKKAYDGQIVLNGNGRLFKELQRIGDVFFNKDPNHIWAIEIKAEEENRTGNLFLETWSNKSRFTPGWLVTSNADVLLYYFLNTDELFSIDLPNLKKWAWMHKRDNRPRIYDFPERAQSKYQQYNDTWGCCVPITHVEKEIGLLRYFPRHELLGGKAA